MKNPVAVLIDKALNHINEQDPTWEDAQPPEFRASVVERWKETITSTLALNSCVLWHLKIGERASFTCTTTIFCDIDLSYNPYSVEVPDNELRKLLQ